MAQAVNSFMAVTFSGLAKPTAEVAREFQYHGQYMTTTLDSGFTSTGGRVAGIGRQDCGVQRQKRHGRQDGAGCDSSSHGVYPCFCTEIRDAPFGRSKGLSSPTALASLTIFMATGSNSNGRSTKAAT